MTYLTLRRWLVSASAIGAAALVWGAVCDLRTGRSARENRTAGARHPAHAEGEADVRQAAAGPARPRATTSPTARRRA